MQLELKIHPPKIKPKVLFNRRGALGDVLMLTPLIKRFYEERNGECEIYILTLHEHIFSNNPYVTQTFNKLDNSLSFDLIFNLNGSYEKNNDRHVLDAYEELVFGYRSKQRFCELYPDNRDSYYVDSLLSNKGEFIVLHMRGISRLSDQVAKNIEREIWLQIIVNIYNNSQAKILQIGGPEDLFFGDNDRLIDLRSNLTAQQIKLLCARASCFIGSDSGPAHIAACTDVPMVVLYTIAPVEYFLPEREKGVTLPIKADIECQGCLRNVKLGEGLNCKREMQCTKSFSPVAISNLVFDFINQKRTADLCI